MKKSFETGIFIGLISIVFRVILFIFHISYDKTLVWCNLIYVFVVIGITYNLKNNLETNKKITFATKFRQSLIVVALVTIIYRIFFFLYYEFIDVYVAQEVFERTGLNNKELFLKGVYSFFMVSTIISFVISGLIKNKEY